jgi:hypothetical protein
MSQKKPDEYRKFEELAKRLVAVPKTELDKRMGEYEARKSRRKARKAKRP